LNVVEAMLKHSIGIDTAQSLRAEALTSDDEFDSLQGEWDQLVDVSTHPPFFLRYSWNRLWWQTYAPAGSRLLLITCRDQQGNLFGLAPFYWRQRRAAGIPLIREVLFLGTGIFTETSHYLDIIARPGCEQLVAQAIADILSARNDWDHLWLSTIPESSKTLSYLKEVLCGEARTEFCDRSHVVDTSVDWEAFLATLGKSTRRNLLRYIRRAADTHNCEFRQVQTEGELGTAMDALVRLHQARWRSRGEPGSFSLPGFEHFLREAARVSLAEGRLRLWTLALDGQVVAAKIGFLGRGVVYAFQQGIDPDHFKDGLGRVLSGFCIKACIEDNRVNAFDFMGGNTQYKDSWSNDGCETLSVTWERPGMRTRVFNSVNRTRRALKGAFKVVLPSSVRLALHKLRQGRNYPPRGQA
jgi:CelD/BcsL family acetyltransferase involved in cellulose biosynthesis